EGIREAFAAARAQSTTPLAALHEALRILTAPIASPEALSNNLAFLQLDLTDDDFHEQALAHADALVEELWVLLEEAVSQGQLVATDTSRLAEAVYVTYNGALVAWPIRRTGSLADALRDAVEFLLQPYAPASDAARVGGPVA
ncbi:MAG TPA: hypothetical protein VFY90_03915, partial [Tepidiformaceae bacterium]|nr:hypothetical protein [Tepidiformaceae bacterium]